MTLKKELLKSFKLYAVTDIRGASTGIEAKVAEAYRGGVDIVQLRAKSLSDGELLRLAFQMRKLADHAGKLFFVNDRVDIALLTKADGVHVGQDDLPIEEIRRLARRTGAELLVGKSTHSLEQAKSACAEGADYIGVGPVFATPTKPGKPSVGLALVSQVSQAQLPVPFVAIGGIDLTNLHQVLEAGARKAACVRAIFDQEDVYDAAKQLIQQWESLSYEHR